MGPLMFSVSFSTNVNVTSFLKQYLLDFLNILNFCNFEFYILLEGYYVIMMGRAYSNSRLLMYVIFHRLHAINSLRVVFLVFS